MKHSTRYKPYKLPGQLSKTRTRSQRMIEIASNSKLENFISITNT